VEGFSSTAFIPIDIMDLLLDLMAVDISGHSQPEVSPLTAYIHAFEAAKISNLLDDDFKRAYRAVRRQFIARLAQSSFNPHYPQELEDLVTPLFDILQQTSGIDKGNMRRDILAMLSTANPAFLQTLWDQPSILSARIISLAFCDKPTSGTDNWSGWLIQLSRGCDERLLEDYFDPGVVMRLFCKTLAFFRVDFTSSGRNVFDKLARMHNNNPYVALAISGLSGFSASIPILESLPKDIWDDDIWQDTVQWCCNLMMEMVVQWARPQLNSSFITIARATLVHGSLATQERCVAMIASLRYRVRRLITTGDVPFESHRPFYNI
jgi:hypothetical protein